MNETSENKWLTVDESYLLCLDSDLSRTKKTIRQWCRQQHVECKKRITPNGEQWMIDRASLNVKIKSELEFIRDRNKSNIFSNSSEPVRTEDKPVRTGIDPFEPVRTSANGDERGAEAIEREKFQEFESTIRSLEIDKGIRDKHIEFLEKENEKGRKALLGQSRYIGHLETLAKQLDAPPDTKFLTPPLPKPQNGTEIPVGDFPSAEKQNMRYNNSNGRDK